jgi:ArsR family transcriptional regulator
MVFGNIANKQMAVNRRPGRPGRPVPRSAAPRRPPSARISLTICGIVGKLNKNAMNEKDRLKAEARAEVLKALAHPTRIYIVDVISAEGPQCVCELTERIGADTSTVSRHLALLKGAGVLTDRKEGTTVYYSLACDCISDFMTGLENVLRARRRRSEEMYEAAVSQ